MLRMLLILVFTPLIYSCGDSNVASYLEDTRWVRVNEHARKEVWEFSKNGQLKIYASTEAYVDSLVEEVGSYAILDEDTQHSTETASGATIQIQGDGGYLSFISRLKIRKLRDDELICVSGRNKQLNFDQLFDEKIAALFEAQRRRITIPEAWSQRIKYQRRLIFSSANGANTGVPASNHPEPIFEQFLNRGPSERLQRDVIRYHRNTVISQPLKPLWETQKRNVFFVIGNAELDMKKLLAGPIPSEIRDLWKHQSLQAVSNKMVSIQVAAGEDTGQRAYFMRYHLDSGISLDIMKTANSDWQLVYFQ